MCKHSLSLCCQLMTACSWDAKEGDDLNAVPFIVKLCFVSAQLGHAACSINASSRKTAPFDLMCLMTLCLPCLQLYIH